MKKLFLLLIIAASLFGGNAFAYNDDGNVNIKETSGGSNADPVRVYMLVRYPEIQASANFLALSAGDVVVWDTISDDGVTINRVQASGQSRDAVAGIVVATITADVASSSAVNDIGRKNWGYIQTYGICTTAKTSSAINFAGQNIAASNTSGFVTAIEQAAANNNAARLGFAYDTASAGASVEVFINTR